MELYFLRSSEQYMAKEFLKYSQSLAHETELEQYERHFGSLSGDVGVYAMIDNKVAGGAWIRILANGLAFIDHDTPELVLAIKPEYQSEEVVMGIMNQLLLEASKLFSKVSVLVKENDANDSYFEALGFRVAEKMNVMVKELELPKEVHEEKNLEELCYQKSIRPMKY